MNKIKRVFLIVLDSVGIGELPDSAKYNDQGSNTLKACYDSGLLKIPNMEIMGLFRIKGVDYAKDGGTICGAYGRMSEASAGKDTTTGHWEIAGIITDKPMPTYPYGFPPEIIDKIKETIGRGVLCNKPYSGTKVILDYGRRHIETGDLIVYTSADSVLQVAAHEGVVPLDELYRYCEMIRKIMTGDCGVGRVIARPFSGKYPNYERSSSRHDFSLLPPKDTICDYLYRARYDVIGVGKISDIFAGRSITKSTGVNKSNRDGMDKTIRLLSEKFTGLAFVNLVDFDMVYGHRNDVVGYTKALNEFDIQLGDFVKNMCEDDLLIITADHGCDPSTPSTDHSREYVPLLLSGATVRKNVDLGTRGTFADIAATIADLFEIDYHGDGYSFKEQIIAF